MLLPFLAAGFALLDGAGFPNSISATYYRTSFPFLVGILAAASIYLVNYEGYDDRDKKLAVASGIAGLGVILFPCTPDLVSSTHVGFLQLPTWISNLIHSASAIVFFVLQTYIIAFQFTKGNKRMTPEKKLRNAVYRLCAALIVASTAALVLLNHFISIPHFVWAAEVIPLVCIGYAYTIKAGSWEVWND